jgi:hypothetical protein
MAHALAQAGTKTGVADSSRTDSYMPLTHKGSRMYQILRLCGRASGTQ